MKSRFSTVDLRAVLAELNARYGGAGQQARALGAQEAEGGRAPGGREPGPGSPRSSQCPGDCLGLGTDLGAGDLGGPQGRGTPCCLALALVRRDSAGAAW